MCDNCNDNCNNDCGDCNDKKSKDNLFEQFEGISELLVSQITYEYNYKFAQIQESLFIIGNKGNDLLIKRYTAQNNQQIVNKMAELYKEKSDVSDKYIEAVKADTLLLLDCFSRYLNERDPTLNGNI